MFDFTPGIEPRGGRGGVSTPPRGGNYSKLWVLKAHPELAEGEGSNPRRFILFLTNGEGCCARIGKISSPD